jgi:hypothetical protein
MYKDSDEADRLRIQLSAAEVALTGAGTRSADGKVWVPPVNAAATKLYQLRNRVRALLEESE